MTQSASTEQRQHRQAYNLPQPPKETRRDVSLLRIHPSTNNTERLATTPEADQKTPQENREETTGRQSKTADTSKRRQRLTYRTNGSRRAQTTCMHPQTLYKVNAALSNTNLAKTVA